jgi:stage II sporulation protein D
VRWRAAFASALGVIASCTSGIGPEKRPPGAPTPATRDFEIRIGVAVGARSVTLGGSGSLVVSQPDGSAVVTIPKGQTWRITAAGDGLTLLGAGGWMSRPLDAITLSAEDGTAPLWVNGKPYRGVVEVLRDRDGLTVVNRLGMEDYLLGVVSAEMGRRSPSEQPALRAQAVVSRTYAFRNLGRWRAKGFDLSATVSDQAYGGVAAETTEGRAAVAATRGQVLTYKGGPVEAFYFSTCGGRTAEGYEVFRGARRPYLRSADDVAPNGVAYCRISPRYRWREEWTGESLRSILGRSLPGIAGGATGRIDRISDIRVTHRSRSGRVDQLAVSTGGPEVRVDGHTTIRQVLRTSAGELLRSASFTLVAVGAGRNVTHLVADGMGAGHGVGLCQWGAVGRARAGQGYEQILAAYYPGTKLLRRY